jgi:predicted transcriptional regulator
MSGTANMLKAQQVRAGRVLVGVGQKELAEMAGIAVATLRRMEDDGIGPERSNAGSVQRVKDCLEKSGVEFIAENGGGAGVRLRKV